MTKNEAMQMALDALDNVYITSNEAFHASTKEALSTALAQPELTDAQERDMFLVNGTRFKLSFSKRGNVNCLWNYAEQLNGRWVALVAAEDDCHLQASALRTALAQPEPEPVAWQYELKAGEYVYASERNFDERYSPRPTPLYTAPPQRKEWVNLTADEIAHIALSCHSLKQTADAIEAKLKERNYDK